MNNQYSIFAMVVIAAVGAGCAAHTRSTSQEVDINKQLNASTMNDLVQAKSAEDYYTLGQRYQQNGNEEMAGIAYQKSLKLDANYTKSISGLASIYANNKLFILAIPLFEKVVKIQPSAAHFNNLGYAYYLNQQYEESSRVLQQALMLDQEHQQAKANLRLVNANLKSEDELKVMAKTEEPTTYATVNTEPAELIQSATVHAATQSESGYTVIQSEDKQLQQITNSVFELNQPVQASPLTDNNRSQAKSVTVAIVDDQPSQPKSDLPMAAVSGGITFKHAPALNKLFDLAASGLVAFQYTSHNTRYVEVINGNGLKGIAKAVAGQLEERGVQNLKVADARSFNISATHIQYRTGYRDSAVTLNKHLLNRPVLYRNDKLPANVSVRLVLGRDLINQDIHALLQELDDAAS